MTLQAKICGLKDRENLIAAVDTGAAFVGFAFIEKSPRHVTPDQAIPLAALVPSTTKTVALTANADDHLFSQIVSAVSPDILQLHGTETVDRVAEIRQAFGLPVMKAISIGGPEDLEIAREFEEYADWLLFDAKPTTSSEANLLGGLGVAFDWQLLKGQSWKRPWMLSGGLTAETVCEAARQTGAHFVDVSSGVESARGQKDPGLIRDFLHNVTRCTGVTPES